jgi:crotonobetainyl-CoA:carnitine CoA-transferase CaiB-like acyl-CoA transferase
VDLVSDAHLWSRGLFREVRNGSGENKLIVGPSWTMSREATIDSAAPRLGEHNAYVLGEVLGLSDEEQAQLAAAGALR